MKDTHRKSSGAWAGPLCGLLLAAPVGLTPLAGWAQEIEEVTVTVRRKEENLQDVPVAVATIGEAYLEKQGVVGTADILKLVPGVQFDQSFSASDTRISIRGINSSRGRASVATLIDGVDVSGENVSIGGGSSLANIRLLDLERVEIVKGPQSALYGRNAFAGVINYVTKKPNMDESSITLSGDYGTDDTYNARGTISGPVIENVLALSLTAASSGADGYYTNPLNGQDLNGYENNGLRLAGLWNITDSLELDASLSYENNSSDPRAVVKVANANTFWDGNGNLLPGATDPTLVPIDGYGNWLGTVGSVNESGINYSNSQFFGRKFTGSEDKRWLATAKLNWDLGAVTFRSITSYLSNDNEINEDVDFQDGVGSQQTDPNFFGLSTSLQSEFIDQTDTTQLNQEFILESNDWERGSWLVGAQYFREDADNTDTSQNWFNDPLWQDPFINPLFCGTTVGTFSCSIDNSRIAGTPSKTTSRDTDSYSIFGLVSYDLTEKLTATVEARFIYDKIEVRTNTGINRVNQTFFHLPIDLGGLVELPATGSRNTREFNPRVALDYRFTEDVMFYGSVARGSKPGGFGTSQFARPDLAELEPESLWAYELGTKTAWFDNTLRANFAIFYNEYDDRQVGITVTDPLADAAFGPGFAASGVSNAGSAETQGVEVDLQWLATDYLTLGLGYAYTDTEWTDFDYRDIRENGIPTTKDKAICGNQNGDCSGANIAGIPENALTLLAVYTRPLGGTGLDFFANANAQWEDERNLNDQRVTAKVDDYWRVDAQVGVETDRWSALIYATNLFDDDTVIWGQGSQQDFRDGNYGNFGAPRDEAVFAFLPLPRIVGVRGSYRFGD